MATNDGGPAFPHPEYVCFGDGTGPGQRTQLAPATAGMSLRDYFAAHALVGMLSQPAGVRAVSYFDDFDYASRVAYYFADAMLNTRG